ncbi:hypothetical protein ACIQOU_18600 [Streptomyces sp. NPDC091279]|uniref:hypothetical protein n=1 Tax=Streptomyces sp. NPDC091279 TaxID=3365983 RepID=UPI00381D6CA1
MGLAHPVRQPVAELPYQEPEFAGESDDERAVEKGERPVVAERERGRRLHRRSEVGQVIHVPPD